MNIQKPFFIDSQNPGCIRGGFYDEMGGMLVGVHAQEVCDVLNKKTYTIAEILVAATKANHIIQQWVPQSWIDALLKALRTQND